MFVVGGEEPACEDACDSNDDAMFDISDTIYILSNLFSMGPNPLPPYPGCGTDPTSDGLSCDSFPPCP